MQSVRKVPLKLEGSDSEKCGSELGRSQGSTGRQPPRLPCHSPAEQDNVHNERGQGGQDLRDALAGSSSSGQGSERSAQQEAAALALAFRWGRGSWDDTHAPVNAHPSPNAQVRRQTAVHGPRRRCGAPILAYHLQHAHPSLTYTPVGKHPTCDTHRDAQLTAGAASMSASNRRTCHLPRTLLELAC